MNEKLLTALVLSVAIASGLSGCGSGTSSQAEQKIVLTGSSTVAPLASEIAKRFEAQNPGVRIDVQTGGSSRGISDVSQGLADIGMVSRALKASELEQFQDFAIAKDGIGIIVREDNPVNSLNDNQIVAIFQGEIDNWQQVGGNNASITVVNKAEGRSTLELFLDYFQLENSQIQADVVIGDNQQGIKTIAGNADAIGYVSIGSAERDINQGVPLKLLSVGDTEASTQTVQDGSFPLSRPLNLIIKEQPSGLTQEFIEFARSQEVYDLVEAQNFVPIKDKQLVQKP